MKLTKIKLVNFRNYSNASVSFKNNLNIFVGDNAQGKTNILEAIVIMALTKSHRIGNSPNIIMFNKKRCKITGSVKRDKYISRLSVIIDGDGKMLSVNSNNIKRVADYISYLNVIVFTPDDLEIVKGSPSVRRNLFNTQLSQISSDYIRIYNEYNKLLRTRNEYLKVLFNNSIADRSYLDIITEKLIDHAVYVYKMRNEYIELINVNIDKYYKSISGDDGLCVKYVSNVLFDSYDEEEIRGKLRDTFKKNYFKELNYGMTMYGPHRDDFYFEYRGNNLKFYGSQGQQKLAILAFKLAEIPIFKDFTGTSPVLLMDDIFSELDIRKRNRLLKIINNDDVQSIVTTTDLRNINKKYIEDASVFKVKDGKILRKVGNRYE